MPPSPFDIDPAPGTKRLLPRFGVVRIRDGQAAGEDEVCGPGGVGVGWVIGRADGREEMGVSGRARWRVEGGGGGR